MIGSYPKEAVFLFLKNTDLARRIFLRQHLNITHHKISGLFTWAQRDTLEPPLTDRELNENESEIVIAYNRLGIAAGIPSETITEELGKWMGISVTRIKKCLGYEKNIENKKTINYDNPEKREWRRNKKDYLSENLPKKDREKANVVLLPAEDWRDVEEVYDPLSFKRERLWGAEKDKDLQPKFCEKATELGTNFFKGDVRKLLKSQSTRYKIADLDFKGQASRETLEKILPHLLLDDDAILFLNFQRKREPRGVQNDMRATVHFAKRILDFTITNFKNLVGVISEIHDEKFDTSAPLAEFYEEGLSRLLQMHTGTERLEDCLLRSDILRLQKLAESHFPKNTEDAWGLAITNVVMDINEKLDSFVDQHREFDTKPEERDRFLYMPRIAAEALRGVPRLIDIKSFQYVSPEGNTPFHTLACKFHRPRRKYLQLMNTSRFFLKIALDAWEKPERALGDFEFQNEAGNKITSLENFSFQAKLAYMREGKQITSLRWLFLLEEIDRYDVLRDNDFDVKFMRKKIGVDP